MEETFKAIKRHLDVSCKEINSSLRTLILLAALQLITFVVMAAIIHDKVM